MIHDEIKIMQHNEKNNERKNRTLQQRPIIVLQNFHRNSHLIGMSNL